MNDGACGSPLAQHPSSPAVDLSLADDVIQQHQGQRGALIPILQATQAVYGYLPKEALALIASRLGLSLGKVYGVATFYSQFYLERRGRHVLKLCDGTACHVKGAPLVLAAVEEAFAIEPGETTADGELTMEIVYCMGSCALAPVAVIDGVVAGRIRQEWLVQQVKRQITAA
jgi:NADH:ubiquinone oxidoreductase subunit E